jgi:hypothetical protein
MVELPRADGTWARQGVGNWRDFQVGDLIDCRDTVNKWLPSIVRVVKDGKIRVHYLNWDEKWDDWLPVDSDRLAPKGTHTAATSNQYSIYRRRDCE